MVTATRYLCIDEAQAEAARAAQPPLSEIESAARRFALLGDPTRIRIALVLRETGELCVGDTAKVLGLKVSLVSHHVRAFATQNLAEKRRDGKLVRYRLTEPALELLDHAFRPQATTAS